MIREIGRGITVRNPVWVVPLALPIVLFASTTWEMTLLFSVAVPLVVILTHAVSYPLERWFPPDLSFMVTLLTAGIVVTLAERVLYAFGIVLPGRPLYIFRAIAVSGVMLWPAFIGTRDEPFLRRIYRVTGLAFGFMLGLLVLAIVRTLLISRGFTPAGAVSFAFLVLALGRMAVNQVVILREDRRERGGSQ